MRGQHTTGTSGRILKDLFIGGAIVTFIFAVIATERHGTSSGPRVQAEQASVVSQGYEAGHHPARYMHVTDFWLLAYRARDALLVSTAHAAEMHGIRTRLHVEVMDRQLTDVSFRQEQTPTGAPLALIGIIFAMMCALTLSLWRMLFNGAGARSRC